VTFRAVPKPPNREFQLLERAATPEREAAQARVRLAAEAALEPDPETGETVRRPNLIERLVRVGRGQKT
jgi:hypothetical protein